MRSEGRRPHFMPNFVFQYLFRSTYVSLSLEGKLHQSWVEHQRHDEMKCHHQGQGERRCKRLDLEVVRDHGTDWAHSSKDDHACHHDYAESKGELELLENGWDFLEERRALGFFL